MTPDPLTINESKEKLRELVALFRDNLAVYKDAAQYDEAQYNEARTRADFVDKFFEILGWDVRNTAGHSELYRDVVREDRVYVDGRPKAPDYAFKIGKSRVFFVEAKKPAVSIHGDAVAAFQLRRYGYSAPLALSLLTNFAEFAVYDTRITPYKDDKASVARVFYCTFEDFEKNFDYIYGTFSKDAVLRGRFDRYIETTKDKRGTGRVDDDILALVEKWRLTLAKNVARLNPDLDEHHINLAVQRVVDRILFLRIAEDRSIEQYGDLLKAAKKTGVYKHLHSLFTQADEKYNAGLFLQERWLEKIAIDDDILAPIVAGLYYPDSQYAFDILPIEILGSVYERFLGKTIRLTATHQAKVEEKPEVRKAGGVYYTPQYIVDYIVQETVGRKIDSNICGKKTPAAIATLSVLDPACGSGSFLVGVYTFLLDWYLAFYSSDKELKKSLKRGLVYEVGIATYRLSIEEKQQILLRHIYGVDIDPLAVEVTNLSLYLKLLENESSALREQLFRHSDFRALPNLDANIRCGNSLITSDFYSSKDMTLFGDKEMRKINALDWEKAFPKITKSGGFDCVIGNPPYVRMQEMQRSAPDQIDYFKRRYQAASEGNCDLYTIFIEKGISLLNDTGRLGIICPNKFFTAQYGRPIRSLIATGRHLSHVVNFGHHQVFDNATTYTSLVFLDKAGSPSVKYTQVIDMEAWKIEHDLTVTTKPKKRRSKKDIAPKAATPVIASESEEIPSKKITSDVWNFSIGKSAPLFEKLAAMPVKLRDVAQRVFQGLVTSADAVYLLEPSGKTRKNRVPVVSPQTGEKYLLEKIVLKPLCKGSLDIRRYFASPSKYVLFPYDVAQSAATGKNVLFTPELLQKKAPNAWEYLQENKKHLRGREKGKMRHAGWYGYVYPKNITLFAQPKILTPSIAARASFTLDLEGRYYFVGSGGGGGGGYGITLIGEHGLAYEYVTALLNSRLLDWFIKRISTPFRGGYYAYNRQYIERVPIVVPSNKRERKQHDRLVSLVNQMLAAQKLQRDSISDVQRKLREQRVNALDAQIDAIVYELYRLTDEEIKIVEQN